MPPSHKVVRELFAKHNAVPPTLNSLDWRPVARRVAPATKLDYDRLYKVGCTGRPDMLAGRCRAITPRDVLAWMEINDELYEAYGGRTISRGWDWCDEASPLAAVTTRRELTVARLGDKPMIQASVAWSAKGDRHGDGSVGDRAVEIRTPKGRISFVHGGSPLVQLYRCWSDTDARLHVQYRTTYTRDLTLPEAAAAGLALVLLNEVYGPEADSE